MRQALQWTWRLPPGAPAMALSAMLWAVAEALVGNLPHGVSIPTIVLARYMTHLVALIALVGWRERSHLVRTQQPALQVGRGLLMLGMPLFAMVAAQRASLSVVWASFWVTPLLVVGLAWIVLGEPGSGRDWAMAAASVVGVMLVIRPGVAGLARELRAVLLPSLATALCFSLYLVLTRRLRTERTFTNLFYTAASVLAPLLLAAPLFWQTPPPDAWPILIAVGLVGLAALYLLDRACAAAHPARLAPLLCLQPIVLALLASLASGVRPAMLALAGMGLVAAAIAGTLFVETNGSEKAHEA